MPSKATFILFALLILIGVSQSQVQSPTAIYLFDVLFESALGPDAVANSKVCPGICIPSSVAVYCPKIFEELPCATPNAKCCVRKSDALFQSAPLLSHEPPRITPGINPSYGINEEGIPIDFDPNIVPNLNITTNIQAAIFGNNQTAYQTQSINQDELYQSNLQAGIPAPVNAVPAPVCPGFCMLNILRTFCEYPSIVIPITSSCRVGTICCDNRGSIVAQANDRRPECPGICLSASIRFTCYGNSEITELYKCSRPRTVCCASKTHIHEILGATHHHYSDSLQIPYRGSTPNPPIAYTDTPNKVVKPTKSQANTEICPGVCVLDMFAEFCEAYLTTGGLCDTGSKCCVPPEKYSDQFPANLRILKVSSTQMTLIQPPKESNNVDANNSFEELKSTDAPIIVPKIGSEMLKSSEAITSSPNIEEFVSSSAVVERISTETPAINSEQNKNKSIINEV